MILYIIKEVREELGIKLETLSKLSGIHAIESVTMKPFCQPEQILQVLQKEF